MSDIVIKDMEMPKSCFKCPLYRTCTEVIDNKLHDIKSDNCPLVELPQHSRLGDLDKLEEQVSASITDRDRMYGTYDNIEMIIENAPTILEASKED